MRHFLFLLKTLISRKWLLPTIVVLIGMGFLARLGIWQLDRLAQRRASNAELRLALDAPPLDLGSDSLPDDLPALKDHEAIARGVYDFDRQVVLKLQNWGGQTGVHLVTPLLLEGGETAVLVDRGWVPESEKAVSEWSKYDEPGQVTVSGYIARSQTLSRPDAATDQLVGSQRDWYRVDIEAIQAQMPYQLLPVYVSQAPSPGGDVEPPYRSERDIDLSEGPHLGYAIQWFIFSLMLLIIYMVYVNKNTLEE